MPGPLSETLMDKKSALIEFSLAGMMEHEICILPPLLFGTNLIAFVPKLSKTCYTRSASPETIIFSDYSSNSVLNSTSKFFNEFSSMRAIWSTACRG